MQECDVHCAGSRRSSSLEVSGHTKARVQGPFYSGVLRPGADATSVYKHFPWKRTSMQHYNAKSLHEGLRHIFFKGLAKLVSEVLRERNSVLRYGASLLQYATHRQCNLHYET